MLNVRFIVKMLGVMFILETFFMLAATVVAFLYRGSDVYPLLISSGILWALRRMNTRPAGGKEC